MVVIDGGNTDGMLAVSAAAGLMQLLHHGTTDGVTGSCHELVLEAARRAGDAPALVADPRQAIELISNAKVALIVLLAW